MTILHNMSTIKNLPLITTNTYSITDIEQSQKQSKFTNTYINNHITNSKSRFNLKTKKIEDLKVSKLSFDSMITDYQLKFNNEYKFKFENRETTSKKNSLKEKELHINNCRINKYNKDYTSRNTDRSPYKNSSFQLNLINQKKNEILKNFQKYYLKYDLRSVFDNSKKFYSSYKSTYFT